MKLKHLKYFSVSPWFFIRAMLIRFRNCLRKFAWILFSLPRFIVDLFQRADYVCYYPAFKSKEAMVNHYYRARWYLPEYPGICTRVMFFKAYKGDNPGVEDKPPYMCDPPGKDNHINILKGKLLLFYMVIRSKEILLWKKNNKAFPFGVFTKILILLLNQLGKRISRVATDDVSAREYRTYCELLWWMLPQKKRKEIVNDNKRRFKEHVETIKEEGLQIAYVFGNGPSLEDAYQFNFNDGVRIMCNTVVGNQQLLDHIKPHFVAAADAVSHLGVSSYAGEFRSDLIKALRIQDFMFITFAQQGFIILANYPELRDRTFLIPLEIPEPNFDLTKNYWLPGLESILNNTMLPLAATFADDIRILGCDGKTTSYDNEDFWAHAKGAQYNQDKVRDGHLCHPVFDLHRQKGGYERYQIHVAMTVLFGEQDNKSYGCLKPSNIPVLNERFIAKKGKIGALSK